ncbi:MAG: excinuclease ABC subunit UvrC [Eubacterium sp.]
MFVIEDELKKLPKSPGVYIMHGEKDEIIYVGKAVILRNRVRQYFRKSTTKTSKIQQMVSQITRFEYIVTDSELEALILECNLIKEYRPKYNTLLKDDKSYPYIKITLEEEYPRILFSRTMKKDKCKYYGPFTSAAAVKDTIELIRKMYKLRSCNKQLPKDIGRTRPCLYHHIHQCSCPCGGFITPEEYKENVKRAMNFLDGDYLKVLKELEDKMNEAAQNLDFEAAKEYRDLTGSIKHVIGKQKITNYNFDNRDIIAYAKDEKDAVVQVFFVRGGKIVGREHFFVSSYGSDTGADIIENFVKQYYSGTPYVPKELMLQTEIEDKDIIESWLTSRIGTKVQITVPKKGQKEKLIELAAKNAEILLAQDREKYKREQARTTGAVKELESFIGVEGIVRIEAFDISNTNGFESVGSMVVYENGRPKKNDYRKYKIKWVKGADDYSSMAEVLTRRLSRGINEQTRLPDLILMDGGRGQVNVALSVLEKLQLNIPVCGMVKDDHHRTRGLYHNNEEIPIEKSSEAFRLITRIQDEAHRFAIEYHKNLRAKSQTHSILDDIDGIGPTRRRALMRHFKSLERIRDADISELSEVESMNEKSARNVYEYFH